MASAISPVAIQPTAVTQTPADWQKAVNNTYDHGKETEIQGLPLTRGLEDIDGPTNKTHHADYINLWGGKDSKGSYVYNQVTLVSEDWELGADGKFHIDQWLYQANPDGTGINASHDFLVEDTGGRVYDSGNYKVTDQEASSKLSGLASKWAKFQPTARTNIAFAGAPTADSAAGAKHVADAMTSNGFSLRAPVMGVKLR